MTGCGSTSEGRGAVRPRDVDLALDRLSCISGQPRQVRELPGGLTNVNYRVTTATHDVVVRMSSADSSLLSIDRAAEYANSRAAARAGVAPDVVEYLPGEGMLVVEYIESRTLDDADLHDEGTLARVAAACRQLHQGPRFVNDFDMFAVQRRYLETVRERGFRLPDRYEELLPQGARVKRALTAYPIGTVPCHNDLLAANLLDDGDRIWIIDYEYAGNNDPCFELGDIWSEATLPLEHLDVLVAAYFGSPDPALVARARLLGLMSKYGWTLWASIQDAVSDQDFDFWSWGMQKYDRAVAEFDGPDFERLLEAAAHPPKERHV